MISLSRAQNSRIFSFQRFSSRTLRILGEVALRVAASSTGIRFNTGLRVYSMGVSLKQQAEQHQHEQDELQQEFQSWDDGGRDEGYRVLENRVCTHLVELLPLCPERHGAGKCVGVEPAVCQEPGLRGLIKRLANCLA